MGLCAVLARFLQLPIVENGILHPWYGSGLPVHTGASALPAFEASPATSLAPRPRLLFREGRVPSSAVAAMMERPSCLPARWRPGGFTGIMSVRADCALLLRGIAALGLFGARRRGARGR